MPDIPKKLHKPPGKRLLKNMTMAQKYWILGGVSALLIGTGLAVLCEASLLRFSGEPFVRWFFAGVFAFILIIGGLGLLQISTRYRTLMEVRRMMQREIKKSNKQISSQKSQNQKKAPNQENNKSK